MSTQDNRIEAVRQRIVELEQKYHREADRFKDEPEGALGYVAGEWIAGFERDLRSLWKLTEPLSAPSGSSTEGQVARDGEVVVDRDGLDEAVEAAARRYDPYAFERAESADYAEFRVKARDGVRPLVHAAAPLIVKAERDRIIARLHDLMSNRNPLWGIEENQLFCLGVENAIDVIERLDEPDQVAANSGEQHGN